jgi:hypothetical protein
VITKLSHSHQQLTDAVIKRTPRERFLSQPAGAQNPNCLLPLFGDYLVLILELPSILDGPLVVP